LTAQPPEIVNMSITQGSKIKLSAVNHINKIFPKMPENIILDAVSEGYSLLLQSDFKSNNEYLQICWLIKTSKRIIYKELKKRKRELLFSELTNDSVDSDNNIENLLIDEQPEQNIGYNLDTEIILNYFSEKEREFIKLLDEGYSFQEIANKFSKSIAAIYQMAHRIKLKNQILENIVKKMSLQCRDIKIIVL